MLLCDANFNLHKYKPNIHKYKSNKHKYKDKYTQILVKWMQVCLPHFRWLVVLTCYEMRHHPQLSVSKWRSVHSVDSTHVKFFKYTNTRKNIHKYKLLCYEMRPHPQLSVSKWRSICTCQIPQISDFHSSKFQILHLKCHT